MNIEVNWRPHVIVSGLHAAELVSRNQSLADLRLNAGIHQPAMQFAAEIRAAGLPSARFWRHLVPLAANLTDRRQLVETAVTKTIGRGGQFESIVSCLVASLVELDRAAREALPELGDQLALRERPLREQWEARGAGMLTEIGRLTDESLIATNFDVLLVHPALGGGGDAHLAYNSVRIEAVLANPVAELPEAVRLAWLVSQLQLDLPVHSEEIHADRLPHIARYAMVPATLIAAESVELVRFAPDALAQAISAWHLAVPPGMDAASLISEWWQTYQETRPPWNVALAALDQMFG